MNSCDWTRHTAQVRETTYMDQKVFVKCVCGWSSVWKDFYTQAREEHAKHVEGSHDPDE
jgi:hypothetical protein